MIGACLLDVGILSLKYLNPASRISRSNIPITSLPAVEIFARSATCE